MDDFCLPLLLNEIPAGRLGSYACLAGKCGFATVDSVLVSGAATPERYRHCCVRDWPRARRRSAPTPLQRGPCGYAASPALVFSSPAPGTRSRALHLEQGTLFSAGSFPAVHCSTEKTWTGSARGNETNGEQPDSTAEHGLLQLLRVGGTGRWDRVPAATSISSCCISAGSTPDSWSRCNGVFAGS